MARKMDFPGKVARGEAKPRERGYFFEPQSAPGGFRAETVNETCYCDEENYVGLDAPSWIKGKKGGHEYY